MPVFHDRRTGETEDLSPAARLYGAGNIEAMFPEGIPKTGAPWPRAGMRKHQQTYDPEPVKTDLLRRSTGDTGLVDVDPRMLKSTQPNVTRAGVQYYLGNQWRETGKTFADQANIGNQYPMVYGRKTDGETEELLLSGHHRAAAALLEGKPLRARRVEGGWGPPR